MAASGICAICGSMGMDAGGDGFFYCFTCGSQSQTLQEQDLDEFEEAKVLFVREANVSRKLEQDAVFAFQQGVLASGGDGDPYGSQAGSAFASQAEQETLLRIMSQNSTDVASAEEELRNRMALASHYSQHSGMQFWHLSQTDGLAALLEKLGSQFRAAYVKGVQKILQMQCEALVEQCSVSPLICGIVGAIWLRFVASTHVFEKEWADEAIQLAEAKEQKEEERSGDSDKDLKNPKSENMYDSQIDRKRCLKKKSFKEPVTSNGLKVTSVWLAAIKERIPLTVTLAISFLACHIAREPVLPTDITKWALEGVLPYLAAFLNVDLRSNGQHAYLDLLLSKLDSKRMFKPMRMISARMVEFLAAHIAVRIGLELPPVNSYALSCRFLKELNLPVVKLAGYVCHLYEWYSPSSLWLEAREEALPSRVYVMAMIFVTLKILYKLDGRGFSWQNSHHLSELQQKHETDDAHYSASFGQALKSEFPLSSEELKPFNKKCNLESLPSRDVDNVQSKKKDALKAEGSLVDPDLQFREETGHTPNCGISNQNNFGNQEWNAKELISNLERTLLTSNSPSFDYQQDLPTYLRYCKNIIFSGESLSLEEDQVYDHFWKLYEKTLKEGTTQADSATDSLESQSQEKLQDSELDKSVKLENPAVSFNSTSSSFCDRKGLYVSRTKDTKIESKFSDLYSGKHVGKETRKENDPESRVSYKQEGIEPSKMIRSRLIEEMEASDFHYLPPISRVSEPDQYLCYRCKRMKGRDERYVHGDYFIVLFACAKVVQVDPKVLHRCIQQLEKQLKGIEKRIDALKLCIKSNVISG